MITNTNEETYYEGYCDKCGKYIYEEYEEDKDCFCSQCTFSISDRVFCDDCSELNK